MTTIYHPYRVSEHSQNFRAANAGPASFAEVAGFPLLQNDGVFATHFRNA